jgi:hypothetical protein
VTLPRFVPLARIRPFALLAAPVQTTADGPCPQPAPSAALVADGIAGPVAIWWSSGDDRLTASYADGLVALEVTAGGRTSTHRGRRHGHVEAAEGLALTLTGTHLTALTCANGAWTARARIDLATRVDTRDESWLAGLAVGHTGDVDRLEAGGFGQLGLRDLRVVSHADGSPYLRDGLAVLSATSAGPGFFDTAHTSIWTLDPDTLALEHRSDLFFRRPDRPGVYGDHATHLVRDGERWLVATSTWGDFDATERGGPELARGHAERRSQPREARHANRPGVSVTLARSDADLLTGRHVLDTEPLALPTDGFISVGVWDPHLVHTGDEWLVGYVSARRFFRFHTVLAGGPSLDRLAVRGVDTRRRATEGTTLARLGGAWRVLASDGRDGRRGQRERYPVFDLAMTELGTIAAPYPTNIPWPTLLPIGDRLLLVGFDGTRAGGGLLGYGTHGDVVIAEGVE